MRGEGCAAAPAAMAVDITLLFKASVKTVKTRNKALGVAAGDSARDELLKRGAARSKSDFTGRAREVVSAGTGAEEKGGRRRQQQQQQPGPGSPPRGAGASEPRVPADRPPSRTDVGWEPGGGLGARPSPPGARLPAGAAPPSPRGAAHGGCHVGDGARSRGDGGCWRHRAARFVVLRLRPPSCGCQVPAAGELQVTRAPGRRTAWDKR